MNHYERLGLAPTAGADEVRAAYRELALRAHPDKGGDPVTFQGIQAAHDTLADTERRQRYDRLLAQGGGAEHAAQDGVEARFVQDFGGGAFAGHSERPAEGDGSFGGGGLSAQLERNAAAEAEERRSRGADAVAELGVDQTHSEGFAAWLRNSASSGTGVLTGDELVSRGLISATGALDVGLPELSAPAVMADEFGPPEEVLSLCASLPCPPKLAHGEVLVRMLAAPVNDEDLLRASTPLHALNALPPFDQADQQWEATSLPAVPGVDGVGVVVATAHTGDRPSPLPSADAATPLDVKQWVVVKPAARAAPVGSWRGLLVCPENRLVAVPAQLMPTPMLACARVFATAWRLLEDFGSLRSGDTVIQNAGDEAVGVAVLQLCRLLRLNCICVLADTPQFLILAQRLKEQYGAVHVVRDGPAMADALAAAGVQSKPRLALDAWGGESGRRLLRVLRAGSSLVCYALRTSKIPTLDVSLLLYQQISLHGFSLAAWVEQEGAAAYASMLERIAELVARDKLKLHTVSLSLADGEELKAGLRAAMHGGESPGDRAATSIALDPRPKVVLGLGTMEEANAVYFQCAEFKRQAGSTGDHLGEEAPSADESRHKGATAGLEIASVSALLSSLELTQYVDTFVEEEFTLEVLRESAQRPDELRATLKELGMKKLGHREKLITALRPE